MFSNVIETNPYKRLTINSDGSEWNFLQCDFAKEIRVIETVPFLMLEDNYHVRDWYCDYKIKDKEKAYTIPYTMIVKDGKIGLSLAQPEYFEKVNVYLVCYKE